MKLVSCSGWPASEALVESQVQAGHCGYFALRELLMLRLKVRRSVC